MKARDRNRIVEISKKLELEKLPFKIQLQQLSELGLDIAKDLKFILNQININPSLKWCLSTVKKAKVFTIIYQANEESRPIYKEEIAKLMPEYSYKTVATIIDEGIEKGYYVALDPANNLVSDKKIKNIRPSIEVITAFYNWNITRIKNTSNLIKKYK
jgi:hypothetical protein